MTAPTSVKQPSFVRFGFINIVGVGSSPLSLQSQVYDYGGDAWRLEVGFPPLEREDAAPWYAFLASLRGRKGTFLFGPVTMGTPLGAGAGVSTPAVNGAGQSGETLITDGWTNSTLVLKKGDLFSIDNRLYMVLSDATTNGSGEVTLDIWPTLRTHADNALLTTVNPVGTWRLASNVLLATEVPDTEFHNISFEAEEAL